MSFHNEDLRPILRLPISAKKCEKYTDLRF